MEALPTESIATDMKRLVLSMIEDVMKTDLEWISERHSGPLPQKLLSLDDTIATLGIER